MIKFTMSKSSYKQFSNKIEQMKKRAEKIKSNERKQVLLAKISAYEDVLSRSTCYEVSKTQIFDITGDELY